MFFATPDEISSLQHEFSNLGSNALIIRESIFCLDFPKNLAIRVLFGYSSPYSGIRVVAGNKIATCFGIMGKESYKQGIRGEEIAEKYLIQHGYEILERNFHSQQGEVDIVGRDGNFLVFVEVKNYSYRSFSPPLAAIRKSKRESIIYTARYYLYKNKIKDTNCRFDVVAIYRRIDGSMAVELYKDAFRVN